MLPENEYSEIESRYYLNPQVGLDESNKFIENLRSVQQQNNSQIAKDTAALGTEVSSNLGGLTGADSYFTSRYQTPQTNATVANLRATAQAKALNDVLANEQAIWKKRYQDAYRAYQKRQYDASKTPQTTDPTSDGDTSQEETTLEISSVETEALAKSRYDKLLMKYLQAGYPTAEAEAKAKEDFSKSVSVDTPVEPYNGVGNYKRVKSAVGGNDAYIYTLPNGNTVLVDENSWELIKTGNSHALKNKQTGEIRQVGG